MDIEAALLREVHADFTIETVRIDAPRADEVLVEVLATGLCHTDLAVRDGVFPVPAMPNILGHEGAGVVVAIGAAVSTIGVGDHVALSFASCGVCPPCGEGRPAHCDNFLQANFMGRRPDGSCTHHQHGHEINASFFGQSSFASHALVRERHVVKVPNDIPLELLGPLGCGIQTGAGTILNHLKPPAGSSVAIFGAGAVGLSAVMAAKIAGCATIIAVDVQPARLALALELGATHAIDGREADAVAAIKEITAGAGAGYVVEATGLPAVVAQGIRSARRMGQVALLGMGPMDAPLPLVLGDLMTGAMVRYVIEGDSVPHTFIPQLIEYHRQGRFPFDRLIRFYDIDNINDAVRDTESGRTIKPVIRMRRRSTTSNGDQP
ncbi:NAD(P)-dependent alcohol dehydrogenase [Pseudoduganella namucuonensis]|uniref:Benzyl alcohol dehydrogenase n=1 Tax=Pseudoduganella namucuonensis TaxID=1035707 RepID=A0A1I7KS27_9BURK|nr:NAD(P)-dependent alcohol dehydrogenase [Pseudoduganella namucuonensis]SFV00217.1 benzyl alcohol dehydrogenase [Pseudoduganella namucuonensis]